MIQYYSELRRVIFFMAAVFFQLYRLRPIKVFCKENKSLFIIQIFFVLMQVWNLQFLTLCLKEIICSTISLLDVD